MIGTGAVLAAARECGTDPRVLVTSSAEVYGAVTDPARLPLTEESPTAPLSPYAASKLAAEALAAQAHLGHGQQVITVRPFNHIGPGQSPTSPSPALARRIVEAERHGASTIPVGNLSARRDFTDVRDVVRAYRCSSRSSGRPTCTTSAPAVTSRSGRSPTACLRLAGTSLEFETDPALVRPVEVPRAPGRPGPAGRRHRVEAGGAVGGDPGRRPGLLAGARLTRGTPGGRGPGPVGRPGQRAGARSGDVSGSGGSVVRGRIWYGLPWPGHGPAWPGHGPGAGDGPRRGRTRPRPAR